MNRKSNMEETGKVAQGKELVGKDEHTATGKKDGRTGRLRRATFDDLDAIMDINDNVYEGFDYMPALFYTFMHSKLHAIYVYEEDGKLVSLYNCRFHPERDDLISGLSGRVRPSHQGRGFGSSETTPLATHLHKEHPLIKRFVADTMYSPNIAVKMRKWTLLYHWNLLVYKIADRQWLSKFAHTREKAMGAIRPLSLSYTNGTEWLERSDQLVRFVSKYVGDLFQVGTPWIPTPTSKAGLRHALSVAKVYVSLDPASTLDCSYPSKITPGTGHLQEVQAKGSGPQSTRNRGQDGNIIGLSFSTVLQCKYGLNIDLFFYGDCEKRFLSHIYSHLLHYVITSLDDVRFALLLHFPLTIDSKNVEEQLKEDLGERLNNDTFKVTQAVQYIADFPQAKL